MSEKLGRRKFIQSATVTGAAGIYLSTATESRANTANDRVVLGIMGLNRGKALAKLFATREDVSLKYLCDVDRQRVDKCLADLESDEPQGITDFRQILDDPEIDALVCAAPNHWHGPATILGCQAGKHVYVEKPCSHNAAEGEMMVSAARRHQRVVQVGTQRRSSPGARTAMTALRAGAIGRVYLARAWYYATRGSIGHREPSAAPTTIDYKLWQGPAPERPYKDNVVHYNWHWHWHWGNGELGNNGVHTIDLCRWGLDVDYPSRVTSSGGRFAFEDDQETPDTHTVCFEFPGDRAISWQGLSCNKHGSGFVTFYGTEGTLELMEPGTYRIFDRADRLVHEVTESNAGHTAHLDNFLSSIRRGDASGLHCEIEEGHKSTLLCHLGNISHRVGQAIECDTASGKILNNDTAAQLWSRQYAPEWKPQV